MLSIKDCLRRQGRYKLSKGRDVYPSDGQTLLKCHQYQLSLCSYMCRISRELNLSSSQQSYESYIILLGRIVVGLVKSLNPGGFTFGSISLLLISKRFRPSLKKWPETGNRAWKASGTQGTYEETSSKFNLHCFDWDTGVGKDRKIVPIFGQNAPELSNKIEFWSEVASVMAGAGYFFKKILPSP